MNTYQARYTLRFWFDEDTGSPEISSTTRMYTFKARNKEEAHQLAEQHQTTFARDETNVPFHTFIRATLDQLLKVKRSEVA